MLKGAEHLGVLLEKAGEVGQDFHGGGAQVMLDAFDVAALDFSVEAEEGEETGKGFVAALDLAGDVAALIGEDEAAVFFVFEVAGFAEFLDHAGDGGLADFEGGGDVHDAGVAFFLDQFMDAFEIIFGALAG